MREGVTGSLPAEWWGFISCKLQEVATDSAATGARPVKYADFGGAVDLSQEYQRRIARYSVLDFASSFAFSRALPDGWFRFMGRRMSELSELLRACDEPGVMVPYIREKLEAERRAVDLALSLSLEFSASSGEVPA